MRGYSGSCDFDFNVERYQDPNTTDLLPEDRFKELHGPTLPDPVIIELHIRGEYSYCPGVTWALPEYCYPDESETNILDCVDSEGNNWESKLTHRELNDVYYEITQNVRNN